MFAPQVASSVRDLGPSPSARDVVAAVRDDGVVRVRNFVTDPEPVAREGREVVRRFGEQYEFGIAVKTGAWAHDRASHPQILDLFSSPWVEEITSNFIPAPFKCPGGIMMTHDFRSNCGIAPNGYLHFDRTWSLKFLLYLTDCDRDSGAFECFPGTHRLGRKLRVRALAEASHYSEARNRLAVHYPDLGYRDDDAISLDGLAGTLIVVDTDIFHRGGVLRKDGRERLLIRSHTK